MVTNDAASSAGLCLVIKIPSVCYELGALYEKQAGTPTELGK
jgi:hypothetical protein